MNLYDMEATTRRKFLKDSSLLATSAFLMPLINLAAQKPKMKVAMVGTGGRGIGMWGTSVQAEYNDILEFVGLCDINPGRVAYARQVMKVDCPVFTDFDKMDRETKPDTLIVATTDSTHHEYIIKGLDAGMTVISEKPMTTDEKKCQQIFDAERRSGNKLIVTFNMRYTPYVQEIWELLRAGEIGDIKSVDLNWYLD